MKQITIVTKDHIKLLRAAYVSWWDCETGAPCIDCKRPYGNKYVPGDIHKILTGNKVDYGELTEEQERKYYQLHSETEKALQIVLATGKFKVGKYEADAYDRNWKEVK